jgi:hypothetical protein
MLKSASSSADKLKEKKTWTEELWEWVADLVKWVSDSLFNTLAASWELIMSWTSKISEKIWSKDPKIRESRKRISKHHLNQSKKCFGKAGKWLLNVWKWSFKTVKWTVRTVVWSGVDTVKWLREGGDKNYKSDEAKRK